jgi:hypothetical protein
MFQGRVGKLPYKFIIPVPFLSNPQGYFLGALFEQLSTLHILLSRAPKPQQRKGNQGFLKVNDFLWVRFLIRIPHMTFVPSILYFSSKESKQAFQIKHSQ